MKFKTIEEVIERANNTEYGLTAAVFTNDINKAMAISTAVQAGTVWYELFTLALYHVAYMKINIKASPAVLFFIAKWCSNLLLHLS